MKRLTPLFLTLLLSSCAGVTFHQVGDDDKDRGIRYYPPAPYLLVHTDNAGGLKSEVIFLPDTTQKMSARPYAVFATNTTTLNFDADLHYLTGLELDAKADEVPKAFVAALQTVAEGALKAGALNNIHQETSTDSVPAPRLYRIKVTKNEVQLLGLPSTPSKIDFK